MKRTACRSCGAPIVWAVMECTGARAPFDADPLPPEAQRCFVLDDSALVPVARYPGLFDAKSPRFVSHFATCPDADGWRHG